jgi:hypothetical protein
MTPVDATTRRSKDLTMRQRSRPLALAVALATSLTSKVQMFLLGYHYTF